MSLHATAGPAPPGVSRRPSAHHPLPISATTARERPRCRPADRNVAASGWAVGCCQNDAAPRARWRPPPSKYVACGGWSPCALRSKRPAPRSDRGPIEARRAHARRPLPVGRQRLREGRGSAHDPFPSAGRPRLRESRGTTRDPLLVRRPVATAREPRIRPRPPPVRRPAATARGSRIHPRPPSVRRPAATAREPRIRPRRPPVRRPVATARGSRIRPRPLSLPPRRRRAERCGQSASLLLLHRWKHARGQSAALQADESRATGMPTVRPSEPGAAHRCVPGACGRNPGSGSRPSAPRSTRSRTGAGRGPPVRVRICVWVDGFPLAGAGGHYRVRTRRQRGIHHTWCVHGVT